MPRPHAQRESGRACAPRPFVLAGLLSGLLVLPAGCRRADADLELTPKPAPDIQARAVDGRDFHLGDHRGRLVVLTFGYTSCPDVCPLTLARLRTLLARLGDGASQVEPVFVSVDPERDTPERLHAYLSAFDRRFRGLALGREELERLSSALGVTATRRLADPRRYRNVSMGQAVPYSIDHTAGFFVIDKRGELRLRFPPQATVDRMVAALQRLLDEE